MRNHRPNADPTASTRLRKLLRAAWNLAQAGIALYGLTLTAYLLARLTVGERWDSVAYANNFVPWWALGGAILGGIGLLARWRWLLAALQLPGIATFLLASGPMLLPRDSPALPDGLALTVATYNVKGSVSDPQRVTAVIARLDADVIALQELGPDQAESLAAALADGYPYQALYPLLPVHGVGILSHYPIRDEEVIRPFPDSMLTLRATLDVDGTAITVYVAHPPPPRHILLPVTYDHSRRDAEVTILRERYLARETGPLIVVGDFNMSDQSDAYRQLDALLDDSFREAGRGLGFTFPDQLWSRQRLFPLLLRIDYIWHNAHFAARHAHVGDDSGTSDHRPVVAELILKTARVSHDERD